MKSELIVHAICKLPCALCDGGGIIRIAVTVEDWSKRSSMMWVSVRNTHKTSKYNKPIKGGHIRQRTYVQVATPASE